MNDMTDFDKLIKEKAEQATYSYKPNAWKSFQRKAGVTGGSWKYWIAGITSAVVIGGVVVSTIVRKDVSPITPETTPCATVYDTATFVSPDMAFTDEETGSTCSTSQAPVTTQVKSHNDTKGTPDEANDPSSVSTSTEVPTDQKVTTPRYGRPLVIDVDTIKENVPTDEELRNGHSRVIE